MSLPPPNVSFGEQLFVLATITHIREYHQTISPTTTMTEHQKHMKLLDDIALLLVTQGNSDVAAVMFEQTSHEIIFYYAKNRPSTSTERAYIEKLKEIALSLSDITECTIQLLSHVIPMCRSKILARLKKVIRCLEDRPDVSDDVDGGFREHLVLRMPHLLRTGLSSANVLRSYIAAVLVVDITKCTNMELEKLIRFASIISSYKGLKQILSDDTTIRRLKKLGNYYTATKRIACTVDSFQRTNPSYLSSLEVVFREVLPPTPQMSSYSGDYVATLNRFGASCGLDAVTASAVHAVYPCNPEPPLTQPRAVPAMKRVTHSIHAECTLAIHAIAMHREWKYVELGISKGSCWMCQKFIHDVLAPHGVKFLVSYFHGKLQPGWMCPPLAAPHERKVMERLVSDTLMEIIERTLNRRRSDSFPLAETDWPGEGAVKEVAASDDLSWLGGL